MLSIGLIVVFATGSAVVYYLYRSFRESESRQLDELVATINQIGEGDMTISASESEDRIGDVARAVNDMSANLQEVLIMLWKQNNRSMKLLDHLEIGLKSQSGMSKVEFENVRDKFDEVRHGYDNGRFILLGFKLFGVNLDSDGAWHQENEEIDPHD